MAIVENQMVEVKWNNANKKHYESKGYLFTKNGDIFMVDSKDLPKYSKINVQAKCDWCGAVIIRSNELITRNKLHYCNANCHKSHISFKADLNKPVVKCEYCGNNYKTQKYNLNTTKYCSKECDSKAKGLLSRGEKSAKYVQRIKVKCDWCNETIERTPNRLKKQEHNFCNEHCRQTWHKEVLVKSERYIQNNRKVMLNNLAEGKIKFTETKPHVEINKMLDKLGISYKNEHIIDNYSIDIYLIDQDLLIEVNGRFWHCDNRIYDKIEYTHQLNRIIGDKRKKTHIKKKYTKNILYLWEDDILNDPSLCEQILLKFISNKGKLRNYHSFNYYINNDNKLLLSSKIIKPYMDWSKENLAHITNTEVRVKRTGFQPDKHIEYACDHCGNLNIMRKTRYMSSEKHYCSVDCKNKSQQIGHSDQLGHFVNCQKCNKSFRMQNYRYKELIENKIKNAFCSNACKNEWQRGKPKSNNSKVPVSCKRCKSTIMIAPHRVERFSYCSKECQSQDGKKRVLFNCDMCAKNCETTPFKFNRSKNHFCSNACADSFNSLRKTIYNKCECCNNWFKLTISKQKQRFCSLQCQGVWQSNFLVGKNSNRFVHGKFSK